MSARRPVFLATLGERPQAVTLALDLLRCHHHYAEVAILHTSLTQSPPLVKQAYMSLYNELHRYQPAYVVNNHELSAADDAPLSDILDAFDAEAYYHAVLAVLRGYIVRKYPVHLLVAGGRKAMSIYATLAAGRVFGRDDYVYTVLTHDRQLIDTGAFHAPPGAAAPVTLVRLPIAPTRRLPGDIETLSVPELAKVPDPARERFLANLSKAQTRVITALRQHPAASNAEIGVALGRAEKTVENHFTEIYSALALHYDNFDSLPAQDKRAALLRVLED